MFVLQIPVFTSAWGDIDKQSIAIIEFVLGFGFVDLCGGQRFGLKCHNSMPLKYTANCTVIIRGFQWNIIDVNGQQVKQKTP